MALNRFITPRDERGQIGIAPRYSGYVNMLNLSGSAESTNVPSGAEWVRVIPDANINLQFDGAAVGSADISDGSAPVKVPAGTVMLFYIKGVATISAIGTGAVSFEFWS